MARTDKNDTPRPRRRGRWIRRTLIGLLCLLVALPLAAFGLLQTGWGQRQVLAIADGALAESGLSLHVGEISGLFPFDIAISEFRLDDAEGTAIEAENLRIAFGFWPLFSGDVAVSELAATRLAVRRAPITPPAPPEPETAAAWPDLPVDLDIDRIDIDRLELGAALTGSDMALTVDGSFALAPGGGEATLTIVSLEGRPARLDLSARIDRAAGTLALDLVAEEPEGGVVPRLAGWDYDGPWQLTLTGDGPMADWSGQLHLVAGPEELADLAIAGALDLDTPRLSLSGVVSPPAALLPPEIDPMPVAVDLVASLDPEQATLTGVIDGRGADVTIDAAVSLNDPIAIDAEIEATAADLERTLAGLDLSLAGDARVSVDADGPLDALTAGVTLSAGAIEAFEWSARDVALDAQFAGSLLGPSGRLTFSLDATDPAGPDVDFDAYAVQALHVAATAETDAAGEQIAIDGLVLEAGPHSVSGSASLALAGGPVGFDLTLATDAAATLPLAGYEQATGRLDGRIVGAFDPDAGLGWVEATLAGAGLSLGDPLIGSLAGDAPAVALSGQVDTGYGLQGLSATIALPALTAEISGDLPFEGGDDMAAPLTFDIDVETLTALAGTLGFESDALGGSVRLAGAVGDPLSAAPRATVDVTGEGVQVGGTNYGAIQSTLAVAPDPDGTVLANLQLSSSDGDYGPVQSAMEATYDAEAGTVQVHAVNLAAFGSEIDGNLSVDLETTTMDGTLRLAVGNLGALRSLTGTDLAGSANAQIALQADGTQQNATIDLQARALAVPDAARVESLDARFAIADLLGDIRLNGQASAATVTAESVSLDDVTVDAGGSLQALDLTVLAEGDSTAFAEPVPVMLDTQLRLSMPDGGTALRIASLTADLGDQRIVLGQPATLRFGGGTLAVSDLQLSLLGGTISGSARLGPGSSNVDIEASGLALGRATALTVQREYGATLDRLAIHLEGPSARPNGTIELAASGAIVGSQTAVTSALNNAALTFTSQVTDGMASVDLRIENVTENPVRLQLANALRLSLSPFAADADHGQPLNGRLTANSDLQMVGAFVSPGGNILLDGEANIDIAIGGVGGAPDLTGAGTIRNGAVEVVALGLVLRDLNADLSGEADRLVLSSLSARDLADGTLTANGYVDFGAAGDASVQIDATLNQLSVYSTQFAGAQASGTVSIAGLLAAPTITGDLTVRPAQVRIAELPGGGYVEVDAIDVNGESRIPPEPVDLSPPLAIPLDLRVSMPNAIEVQGYGLETEWGGDLEITGTTAAPSIVGQLTVIRGTMSLGGQPIEIGRGIVTFTGGSPPDPLIDIEASSVTEDLRVILTISGPASSAGLELESVPPLPQEEILGQLLFGAGRGGLAGDQAFQAGRALALLSGGEDDLGIVNTLRSLTGITGLTVEADTDIEGNPAARVGGYVSEDVYLSVSRGSAISSGEAEISVEVFDGVDVDSTFTESGDSKVGISFEWDY